MYDNIDLPSFKKARMAHNRSGFHLILIALYAFIITIPLAVPLLPKQSHAQTVYSDISGSILAGSIFGTVKDQEGRGLAGVTFEIGVSGWIIDRLVTDLSGAFPQSTPFPGKWCSLTISYGKSYTLYPTFPVAEVTAYNFILLPGTVCDHVTGMPLSGVSILAQSHASPYLEAQTATDSDGVFQLFLPAGEYTIAAKLPISQTDSINQEASPAAVPSEDNAKLNFTLHLPILAGTVIDSIDENLTLEGVEINITPVSSTQPLPINNPVLTGSGGKFQIPLPKGTYELEIRKSKYQKRTMTIQINGTIEDCRIELTKQEPALPPPDNPPVIKKPQDGAEIAVKAGEDLSFSVEAEDPENPYLYFTIKGPESWPGIVNEGGPKSIPKSYYYSTTLADLGEHAMEITVSDLEYFTTVNIKVKVLYPVKVKLSEGLNLINYPAGPGIDVDSAFDLLSLLGDANHVEGVALYDPSLQGQGKYILAGYGKDKKKTGTDFFISSQSGYIVYAKQAATANLNIQSGNLTTCILQLKQGTNLVGISAVLSDTYSSYDLLPDLGQDSVESVYHYNAKSGRYECTYWIGNLPGGFDFSIQQGEGYFIGAKVDKQLRLPKLR